MSSECDRCGEHAIDCQCNKSKKSKLQKLNVICIEKKDILELIYWARRYCDRRVSYAAYTFNKVYDKIVQLNPHIRKDDKFDPTLQDEGKYWPYAHDGDFGTVGVSKKD